MKSNPSPFQIGDVLNEWSLIPDQNCDSKKNSKTDDEVRAFSSHFTYVQGFKTKKKYDWAISKFVSLFIVQRKNRQQ